MRQVDKYGLGGESECVSTPDRILDISDSLANTVDKLRDIDGRSEDALKFFLDYYETVKQTNRILKPGQPIALVVPNRTISRVNIPTHRITEEFYHFLGFDVKHTLPRDIPKKTLPFENTPENVPGETGDLMAQEYILIMRAPDW
ncbi:MAG: hypothetical protein U5J98_06870 [Halobacteriales archaeon]|nr:hypothetical protein [Halobacteriales archaeon]